MGSIEIKRVYDAPAAADGFRVLVDRVWPRGMTKQAAGVDLWLKEIAPSNELRKWYKHDPKKWEEFRRRYLAELNRNSEAVSQLKKEIGKRAATLVCAAKDAEHSNARVLADALGSGRI